MESESKESGGVGEKEPFIRLDDFLKLTSRVRSGGEAKHRIQGGEVLVNGAVETRRSRKLVRGDRVTIDGVTSEANPGAPA
jgi:ribosome-associated protein